MQVNRLFEIIYILLGRDSVTAKELAEKFEVSQRTIYRDIDTLSLAGIPVYTEKGRGGGIKLLSGYVLNKSILSENEQNEILSALQGLSAIKPSESNEVLSRISTLFNKDATNWLKVDFSDWSYQGGDTFYDLKTAILTRSIVEFDYFSTSGEKTHRKIEPIQLWFKTRAWYVRAFCLNRQSMRLFKLTRVRNLIITSEKFSERSPYQYLSITQAQTAPVIRQDVTIKFRVAPEMTYRVLDEFGGDCAERQPDGSFIVTIRWLEDEWVYGTLLSFGEFIEVLEPDHIREIVLAKAKKIIEKYTR